MSQQARQRMAEGYLVVWVDGNIAPKNADCQQTLTALRSIVNEVDCCTTAQECVQYLQQNKETTFVISSGALGQHLVPDIHDMDTVNVIYIFCGDKKRHEAWTKNWSKIKGIHTQIKPICEELQLAVKQYNQNNMPISIIGVHEAGSTENLNQLEPSFMYSQIFKEILLDMEHNQQAIQDLAVFCQKEYQDNSKELQVIKEFASTYKSSNAIWWYTRECFIYKMLNGALRALNGDITIRMGFFLCDLHHQIQELHKEQVSQYHGKPFIVYRGQGLSTDHFKKLSNNKGGLISFNNFLSTSTIQNISRNFADQASRNKGMVGILFEMTIDPDISSAPFASIQQMSYFNTESEVLFSMHTVFRICDIRKSDSNHPVYHVELKLTSDDDQQLRRLTNSIREEGGGGAGWARLGYLLAKIGQLDKAEEVYTTLLEQTSKDNEKADLYNQLGYLKDGQGRYEEAVSFYEKYLEINRKTLPENHSSLATCYNNIGGVYKNMGDYPKALKYYQKVLDIMKTTLPANHTNLADSYNNMGAVYKKMGDYSKALEYYQKDLEIMKKTCPENHPDLAISYNNIGAMYKNMNDYSKALEYYNKALKIQELSLPENHSDFIVTYNSIGQAFDNMGDNSRALENYNKALEISKKTLPVNHPSLATFYNNIGAVYDTMGDFSKALVSYEKALKIREISLSENHPDSGMSYSNIGQVYCKMGDYSRALKFLEKGLGILQNSLPSTHPNIKLVKDNIYEVKKKL